MGKGVIIICEICESYVCPSACPNFDGRVVGVGSPIGVCLECGGHIYDGDVHFCRDNKILCAECAEKLIPSELLSFLGCEDINDFFEMLY